MPATPPARESRVRPRRDPELSENAPFARIPNPKGRKVPEPISTVPESEGELRLVSALARGISILRCFSPAQQELSARELVELTGLPKPTLFRLVETLCDLGLLRYSERVSKYVVGLGTLNLAVPALARMTARQLARPLMEDLANQIQGQVQMIVGYRNQLTYVEVAQGAGSRVFRVDVGMRVSMSRTASGRAYLSSLPEAERQAYLAEFRARDPERGTWLAERLADAARDLADHGFCRGHRDLHREIEVIAVPVAGSRSNERIIFAASLAVFNPQSKQLVENVGPRLVNLVRNVENAMGASE